MEKKRKNKTSLITGYKVQLKILELTSTLNNKNKYYMYKKGAALIILGTRNAEQALRPPSPSILVLLRQM